MGRKKASRKEELCSHHVQAKIDDATYERLSGLQQKSDCRSLSELIRRILSKGQIILYHKDASFDSSIQEMIRVRNEVKSIGININQITHAFHNSDSSEQRLFHALKVSEHFKALTQKLNELLDLIKELGRKWLQR